MTGTRCVPTLLAHHVSRAALTASLLLLAAPAAAQTAVAPVAGQNINMVTGVEFPGGDPFLQRQNEPSIAVSSVNPQHLVAGANDYRSVDIPNPVVDISPRNGDAWLGVFKSFNGGQSWQSSLLRGYYQDPTWCGAHPSDGLCPAPAPSCATNPTPKCSAFQAAADPVVRAGTDGLVYFAGLAFDRDRKRSRIVVGRFFDYDDREVAGAAIDSAQDPLVYLGSTAVGPDGGPLTSGNVQFLDKPWIAVDVPRGGAVSCTIQDPTGQRPARTVAAGAVYVAWIRFLKQSDGLTDISSQVMLSRSDDCGQTWTTPVALNDAATSTMNEAPAVAIDPTTGKVYVAWRRVASGTQSDAILIARSFSRGGKFTKQRVLSTIPADRTFDHGIGTDTPGSEFRAWALPTIAISIGSGGNRHIHVAWAQRKSAGGDSRIYMSTSTVSPPPATNQEIDETDSTAEKWSAPVAVDDDPVADGRKALIDPATGSTATFDRGHQVMPSLTYSQGRLVLVYYDSRFDHVRSLFKPNERNGRFEPDAQGRFYTEMKAPMIRPPATGEAPPYRLDAWQDVFQDRINDSDVAYLRHTVDVRAAVARGGPAPVFTSVQLSQYPMGRRGDEWLLAQTTDYVTVPAYVPAAPPQPSGAINIVEPNATTGTPEVKLVQQLRQNPPNLPMFSSGTRPFMGDYIDVQGPAFVRKGSGWDFNTADAPSPVFHAVWTSNQDVRRPLVPTTAADGSTVWVSDWTRYTPVPVTCSNGHCQRCTGDNCASLFDSAQYCAACVAGSEGSRDQNVYTSRLTEGLLVSSPQNTKALAASTFRTFVVLVQNTTWKAKNVRFTLTPATGVVASLQDPKIGPTVTTAYAAVPARSHVFRTVFAKLADTTDPASSVTATVDEVAPPPCDVTTTTCAVLTGGASASVVFNPPGAAPSLFSGTTAEDYGALLVDARLDPADPLDGSLASHDVASHDVASHDVASHDVASGDIASHDVASHDVDVLDNASHDVASHDVASHDVASHDVASHDVADFASASHDVASHDVASLSDLSYVYENTGNTTASWDIVVAGEPPRDAKGNVVPVQVIVAKTYRTPTVVACNLQQQAHTLPVVNVPEAKILPLSTPYPLDALDGSVTRATVSAAPGEEVVVTLRFAATLEQAAAFGEQAHVLPIPQNDPMSIVPACTSETCPPPTLGTVVDGGLVTGTRAGSTTSVTYTNGQLVATVSAATGTGEAPTGYVTFSTGGTMLGIVPLAGSDGPSTTATKAVTIAAGAPITAYYAGNATYLSSSGTVAQATQLTGPASGAASVTVGGVVYAIGGARWGGQAPVSIGSVYALDAASGTWTAKAAMPTPRSGLAAVTLGGKVYAIGGNGAGGFLGTVEVYDPASDAWSSAAPLPTPRMSHGAAVVDGKIYVIGGWNGGPTNTVAIYDPATNAWSAGAPAPTAREDFLTAAVGGVVYVIGGFVTWADTPNGLSTVEAYVPSADKWYPLANMPTPRYYVAGGQVNGYVYALTGHHGDAYTSAAEVFDPLTNQWSTLGSTQYAQVESASAVVGPDVYIVGGYGAPGTSTLPFQVYSTPQYWSIDQPQIAASVNPHAVGGYYDQRIGQVISLQASLFVTAPAGVYLTGVQVPLGCAGAVTVELRGTTTDSLGRVVPSSTPLVGVSGVPAVRTLSFGFPTHLPSLDDYPVVHFDPVLVTAPTDVAVVMSGDATGCTLAHAPLTDLYTPGDAYYDDATNNPARTPPRWVPIYGGTGLDIAFRLFMRPAPSVN